jgi:hypothetical protein
MRRHSVSLRNIASVLLNSIKGKIYLDIKREFVKLLIQVDKEVIKYKKFNFLFKT